VKVLVTGSEGYLGSLVVPVLQSEGHDVIGVDTAYYGTATLYGGPGRAAPTFREDIRKLTREHLVGVDAVVHMAELSNDPVGQLAPGVTYEINHLGSRKLAELAKAEGVTRFVYMSSCSVYGVADGDATVDETSPTNPQTTYAECKVLVERDLHALADASFSPTMLRNATAFGASPHMRFDIVLNNLAGLAWTTGQVKMSSDGSPWRPLVHGLDIASAISCVLRADRATVHDQVLNVGDSQQNYQVREIAEAVAEVFEGCDLSFGPPGGDNRSYRVSFAKIHEVLPEFRCEWSARRGAEQLHTLFRRIDLRAEDFAAPAFTRLSQLEHLRRTGQIDASFFWTPWC
jgi:nucleoside-diphosphate-sugar epimerase